MKIPNKKEIRAMALRIVQDLNQSDCTMASIDAAQDASDVIYAEAEKLLLEFGITKAELERDDIEDVMTDLRNLVSYIPEHYELEGK